jgi:hypothetical protein
MGPIHRELNGSHTKEAFQLKANDCSNYSTNPSADFDANLRATAENESPEVPTTSGAAGFVFLRPVLDVGGGGFRNRG